MELVFIARGVNHQFDIWKTFMQTQRFLWKREQIIDGKKVDASTMFVGALRPIQLYEYVFPKEALPNVLGMMGIKQNLKDYTGMDTALSMLRKMMKLKKIPKDIEPISDGFNYVFSGGVAIHPIGLKEDEVKEWDFGDKGKYYQEGL
jgi:hypothetical protein